MPVSMENEKEEKKDEKKEEKKQDDKEVEMVHCSSCIVLSDIINDYSRNSVPYFWQANKVSQRSFFKFSCVICHYLSNLPGYATCFFLLLESYHKYFQSEEDKQLQEELNMLVERLLVRRLFFLQLCMMDLSKGTSPL